MKTIWEYNEKTKKVEPKEMTFEEVYEQYQKLINNTARKWWQYEDAKQIASIALWKTYENYDSTRGVSFASVAQVFVYRALARYHWQQTRPIRKQEILSMFFENEDGQSIAATLTDNIDYAEKVEAKVLIKKALNELTEQQRKIVALTCYGLPQMEIAREIGTHQVKVSREIKKIRKIFKEEIA